LLLLCCDVGFCFSLIGALFLHLMLHLVHQWSFLTLFFVYFFAIFKEFFSHFLDYVLLHIFCCVMMSTMFFFGNVHIVFGVVTSTLVIITNSACCQFLSNFQCTPLIFSVFFLLLHNAIVSIFLVGELLTLINVVSFCFIFRIYVYVYISCLHRIAMAFVFASRL
jgi:hypothetical protein